MSRAALDPRELDQLLSQVRFQPRPSLEAELLGRWGRGDGPSPAPERDRARVLWLVLSLLLLSLMIYAFWAQVAHLRMSQTIDRCCQDLDGGGRADDGLLVTSQNGEKVRGLTIYEDRDGSGGFTPADSVRFARGGVPTMLGPMADGLRTQEFCCLDYDGGGPSDDALLVLGRPPDRIVMAAIYEHRKGMTRQPLR